MSEMQKQIESLPALIREQVPVLDMRVRAAFTHAELLAVKEIVLTGCGDSYFAGLGARHFFQRVERTAGHHDRRALTGEPDGNGLADAFAGAGDNGNFIFQFHKYLLRAA